MLNYSNLYWSYMPAKFTCLVACLCRDICCHKVFVQNLNAKHMVDHGIELVLGCGCNCRVIMEVEQEVSNVPSTTDEDNLTPRIQQRKISSTVAINSGDTIILGGLIQENRDLSETGIPVLHKVPILGSLFGTKEDNQDRTELIVLISPTAIANSTAALQVTDTFRRRLQKLIPARAPAPEAETTTSPQTGS